MKTIQACELSIGDQVDLVDTPFFDRLTEATQMAAEFELFEVCDIELDEPGKIGVGFESIPDIFYFDPHLPINVGPVIGNRG